MQALFLSVKAFPDYSCAQLTKLLLDICISLAEAQIIAEQRKAWKAEIYSGQGQPCSQFSSLSEIPASPEVMP